MKKGFQGYAVKIACSCLGILLIGSGVAFNHMAGLGNDPVGIFYDGIRNTLGLEGAQLGTASNVVNLSLTLLLLVIGRKYINLGTIIYIIPYGACVGIGTRLYQLLFPVQSIPAQAAAAASGCLMLYCGIAIFIAMDIGMDPMTGTAMVIKDRMHWDFKRAKWLFDGSLTIAGFLLGGKLGVITLVTAVSAGPCIQFLAGKIVKIEKRTYV